MTRSKQQRQNLTYFLYHSTIPGMETVPPHPATDLSPHLDYRLVYTHTGLLPPLDDTPEVLRTRNHAAIAKVAALLPVNARHVAERSMLGEEAPGAGSLQAVWPKAARVAEPAACVDQRMAENVSENRTNSQGVAFETTVSAQPWNRGSRRSGKTGLHEGVRAATALSRSAVRGTPDANRRGRDAGADEFDAGLRRGQHRADIAR